MKINLEKYNSIDKRTQMIFNDLNSFKIVHLKNSGLENAFVKHKLTKNYIQLYFSIHGDNAVAFNLEHCVTHINNGDSRMVYFKEDEMNILYNLPPLGEVVAILISIEYFHSLFSIDGNMLINFSNFNSGRPIIEPKQISQSIKLILNQLISNQTNQTLRPIYVKGKVYELLSYYFSNSIENDNEHCPYIASEETISKIKQAKEIIIKEMNNPPSLAELSKLIGLNIKKLKTDFKEIYGVPVFTFLLNYKMEVAKNLLQEQQLNVNEISSYLGYSTSSHFIAAFKRKHGITPKQFAKT
jgi:AraC-like DNA-binding protein